MLREQWDLYKAEFKSLSLCLKGIHISFIGIIIVLILTTPLSVFSAPEATLYPSLFISIALFSLLLVSFAVHVAGKAITKVTKR